jgi:IS30 family transposase
MPPSMHVPPKTIYKSLYVQARGSLRKDLMFYLRERSTRGLLQERQNLEGQVLENIRISNRPSEDDDRAVPGHWEADLIIGKNGNSAVGTLVERHSRYLMLLHLPNGQTAPHVRSAIKKSIKNLSIHIRQTLTWHQKKQPVKYKIFSIEPEIQVLFCDPRTPWLRGSSENINGLIRQYLPKGVDLSIYTRRQLNSIEKKLNIRPRKTFGWQTPAEVLGRNFATIA